MKKLIILLAAVFIAAAFSGCSTLETDTEALMQPPSLTEEQAKLNDALKSVIGDSFYLKYPMNEGSNSAFMFCDVIFLLWNHSVSAGCAASVSAEGKEARDGFDDRDNCDDDTVF